MKLLAHYPVSLNRIEFEGELQFLEVGPFVLSGEKEADALDPRVMVLDEGGRVVYEPRAYYGQLSDGMRAWLDSNPSWPGDWRSRRWHDTTKADVVLSQQGPIQSRNAAHSLVQTSAGTASMALEEHLKLIRYYEGDQWKSELEEMKEHFQAQGISAPIGMEASFAALRSTIAGAETYWVSAEIGKLIQSAAESLDDWECDFSLLPSPSGFVHLEAPLKGSLSEQITSLYWTRLIPVGSIEALRMYIRFGSYMASFELHERQKISDAWPSGVGMSVRFIPTLLLFMNQDILRSVAARAVRATRRRIEAWREEPLVHVVHLRAVHYRSEAGRSHEPHDWACRWLVRGHWRNQPYPKDGIVRPKWIAPYVKGPDDKPIKAVRARVFAVVR